MSKELEALKDIKELFTCHDFDLLEKCSVIERALQALEIIKNSGYISIDIMLSQNYITRKEYDLLKEVFYELPTKQV